MNGWDFAVIWAGGQAVLHGQDPYSVEFFYYPLPLAYALAILAVLPQEAAFWLWLAANLGLLLFFFRRRFWQWLLFVPILHQFSSGQLELVWWSLERCMVGSWRSALLGAVITLKPQTALLLLPWHLLQWLRYDRVTLARWAGLCLLLWGFPMLWRPGWILDWLRSAPHHPLLSASNTPGMFSLMKIVPSIWPLLAIAALIIFSWGQFRSKEVARATAVLTSPVGLFYSTLALLDCAPARVLIPISLLAAALSLLVENFVPFMALPVAVLLWHWLKKSVAQQAAQPQPVGEVE